MESIIEGYGYRLELGDWPLVVVRYPAHPPDPVTGYRWLFERYAELCARGTGIAWLVDFALAGLGPAVRQVDWASTPVPHVLDKYVA